MFLVLHLILVAKQQTRVLGGLCCHPIFNSPLCAKITVSFKWTIAALLSMVAQVFLWNQFIISSFVLCKGCSHRCRLGSWWCLSHIPYRVPFAVGKRMNGWDKLFWSPYAYGKLYQKFSCLGCYKMVYSHSSLLPHSNKYGNGTQPGFVWFFFFFLMPFDFKPNYSL